MTEPDDPFTRFRDSVTELPPTPGTFENALRRAAERRRRKIVGVTAAALVAVAAGAGILVGAQSGGGTSNLLPPATVSGQPIPSTAPQPTRNPSPAGPTRGSTPTITRSAAAPVPAGFTPRSISFVAGGVGWLLGDAPTCARRPCTSLLRTDDGGATWRGGPAPVAPLAVSGGPDTAGTIRDIRFVDRTHGFAYGAALYAPADAGTTWRRRAVPGNHVADLEAWNGTVYLVVESCAGTTGQNCHGGELYRMTAAGGALQRVPGWPTLGPEARIALQNGLVAVAARNTEDGVAFHLVVQTSGAPVDRGEVCGRDLGGLAAAPGGVLWEGCNGGAGGAAVAAQVSTDAGATWRTTRIPPPVGKGQAASAAAIDASTAVLTGQDSITRTADGGRSWQRIALPPPVSPAVRLGFVGFRDDSNGYVISGYGGPAQLWRTADGGRSWIAVTFR